MERLQKVIANLGYCSRRHAEKLIKEGKVLINGHKVTELGTKVTKSDEITIEGNTLDKNYSYVYYILNKPRGVVTTSNDDLGRKTVIDLIDTKERIYPVGRLDYDTTGLLLLTNDGYLANALMHPSNKIDKTYIAKIEGILTPEEIKKLKSGVIIDDYKTSPCRVKVKKIDKKKEKSLVELTIHEGKNHQIKKMLESVGKKVVKLKREQYANLDLTGLKSGSYRRLSNKEISILYSMVKK